MFLKLFGSLIVLAATTTIGFGLAGKCMERPRQISQTISCIVALKSYINYAATPLPEALLRCTKGVEGPVTVLFQRMASILRENGWLLPQEAMEVAIKELEGKLALGKNEIEILKLLGANLGAMNKEEQQKHLYLIQRQLQNIEAEALKVREQNVKMYQYLGVCGGLVIVILLV